MLRSSFSFSFSLLGKGFKSLYWFNGLMVGSIFRFWLLHSFEYFEPYVVIIPSPLVGRVGDGIKQQTTNNKQQTTNNKQQTPNNKHQTTNNKRHTPNNHHFFYLA